MTVEHVFVSRSKYYILMGSINQVLINKVELSITINHNAGKTKYLRHLKYVMTSDAHLFDRI